MAMSVRVVPSGSVAAASMRRPRLWACGWIASSSTSTGSTIAVRDDVRASPAAMSIVSLPSRSPTGVRVGGAIGEEQPDADLHRLGLPGRLHVQLHDEVAAGLQAPRHAVRRRPRPLTGRPAEHVARRVRARPAPCRPT